MGLWHRRRLKEFCSHCRTIGMEQWFFENGTKRRAEEAQCTQCEQSFLRRKGGKKKLCSPECRSKSLKKRKKVSCANCRSRFDIQPSRFNQSKHKQFFCSQKCHNEAQRLESDVDTILPKHYGTGKHAYRCLCRNAIKEGCSCGEKRRYLLCIHHKDGDRKNKDRNNLEVVCGNCHILRHLKKKGEDWVYSTYCLTPRNMIQKLMGM